MHLYINNLKTFINYSHEFGHVFKLNSDLFNTKKKCERSKIHTKTMVLWPFKKSLYKNTLKCKVIF